MNKSTENPSKEGSMLHAMLSLFLSFFISFCPVCPICLSTYAHIFGLTMLQFKPYASWVLPIASVLLLINLLALYKKMQQSGRISPFLFSSTGSSLLIGRLLMHGSMIWVFPGILFVCLGALLNGLSTSQFKKITTFFRKATPTRSSATNSCVCC